VATAVRLARPICFPSAEKLASESFLLQQARRRLWCIICVLDHQTSFSQGSRLITLPDEIEMALELLPAAVNDDDFDANTKVADAPAERAEFSDTTYALLAAYTIPMIRMLNAKARSSSRDLAYDPRHHLSHIVAFERNARALLQVCDPESSDCAWFTWHSSQYMVATGQLAALQPATLRLASGGRSATAASPSIPSDGGQTVQNSELLRLTLLILEKVHLIHTDPRGQGFLWSVNIPWHALAIAFAQVSVCTDLDLLRRAWPLVEASLAQQKEALTALGMNKNLHELMQKARERMSARAEMGDQIPQANKDIEMAQPATKDATAAPEVDLSFEPIFPVEEWNSFPLQFDFDIDAAIIEEHLSATEPQYAGFVFPPNTVAT
jgi:hypothetical protein